jgi:DNA ligase (NAD+)
VPLAHGPLSCWQATPGCEQQFRARLVWLGGRQGLQLEGLGADTWQALIDAGLVHGLLDWMRLTPEQQAAVPGLGTTRAATLARAFAGARDRPFPRWLHALGLPAEVATGLPDWHVVSTRAASDWRTLDGVGASRANQLVEFFECPDVRAQAAFLHAAGVQGF